MTLRTGLAGSLAAAALTLSGCPGDDTGGDGGTASSSSSGSSGPVADDADDPGDDGVDATTDEPGTTDDGNTTDGGQDTTTDDGGSSEDDGSSSGGPEVDCTMIPDGPFTPEPQFMPAVFSGSEDLAFDGMGNLAGKNGGNVRLVDSTGTEVALYPDAGNAYGVRYRTNGDLLVAHFQTGVITQITPAGAASNFATGYGGVNGLYPDFDDAVWITDFARVGRINSDGSFDNIVTGGMASAANGIVYDPGRGFAFFTNYSAGRIRKVVIDDAGAPGAITDVGQVMGAAMDGLSLDICGNLYAVDQGNSRLYRVMLDDAAETIGGLEDILDSNIQNIANAQFGRGAGFDPLSIYAAGTPGVVYRIEVGVPGAPIPLP